MFQKQFPKSATALAVAAAIGAGGALMSPVVTAATLDNADRLGDAAIFSYYTARGDWQTFFRIINTSADAVVVKVRFREAANSREVLDFFIALSPFDMWSGWTDANALGGGSGPGIRTNDTSCIFPAPDTSPIADGGFKTLDPVSGVKGALFKDAAFTGVYNDLSQKDSVDRMSEGHFYVIGVNRYTLGVSADQSDFVNAVSHNGANPANCGAARQIFYAGGVDAGAEAGNVIGANAYLMNIATGQGAGYDPDILRNCSSVSLRGLAISTDTAPDLDDCDPQTFGIANTAINQRLWNGLEPAPTVVSTIYSVDLDRNGTIDATTRSVLIPGRSTCTTMPENNVEKVVYDAAISDRLRETRLGTCDLALVAPTLGQPFLTATDRETIPGVWRVKQKGIAGRENVTGGVDNVSAEFMRTSVINEWAASLATDPAAVVKNYFTQWVLTFPTKHYYVDLQNDGNLFDDISPALVATVPPVPEAFAPFYSSFVQGRSAVNPFNEAGKSCEPYTMEMWNREERFAQFTSPGPYERTELCNETNVITFGQDNPLGLGSAFSADIPLEAFPTDVGGNTSERGWAQLTFTGPGSNTGLLELDPSGNPTILYRGLPVTGFLFSVYETGDVMTNQATGNAHKYIYGGPDRYAP